MTMYLVFLLIIQVQRIRLGGREGASEGQVEILLSDGQWRTLCLNTFRFKALVAICKEFGFLGANKINSISRSIDPSYPLADFSFSCPNEGEDYISKL